MKKKRFLPWLLLLLILIPAFPAAAEPEVTAPGAILIEVHTGQILYEKGSHTQLRPASVTKIMTILLTYEAARDGQVSLEDLVTVSETAAGYGGSTILLETGEQITLRNLVKGMCIASGNDAAVAAAEYVGGSISGFVDRMNRRAEELGMKDTHFVNPCGLDADGHVTSAHDIALMSRELLLNFPEVIEYTTTWHEMMPHNWRKGPGETDMANTNKLIRSYEGMTGLKTGFTRLAKYSLSASAVRGDLSLVAVIMGAETKEQRSKDVVALLDYGFGSYSFLRLDTDGTPAGEITVTGGTAPTVPVLIQGDVNILTDKAGSAKAKELDFRLELPSSIPAPVQTGDAIGEVIYSVQGTELARLPLVAGDTVPRLTWFGALLRLTGRWSGLKKAV